jgi:hypothetical protein
VPLWYPHYHVNRSASEEALLFSMSDAPVLKPLELYREEPVSLFIYRNRAMSFFEELISEMNEMSNRVYETPEFKSLDEVKLTMERARFYAAHAVYFNMNRRDCWGHVQGSVP